MEFGATERPLRLAGWSGSTVDVASDRGEGLIERIVGGYVRGGEIRTWPGWRTVVDPTIDPTDPFRGVLRDGYRQKVVDARRPVVRRVTNEYVDVQTVTDEMYVWADPVHMHCFATIRGALVLIGESGQRVEPILATDASTDPAVVTGWTKDGSNRTVLTLSFAPAVASGHHHRVEPGDALWVDELDDLNTADAAILNGKSHNVVSIAGANVTLATTIGAASISSSLNGMVGRTRGNKTGDLGQGKTPYEGIANEAVTDPDALTAWYIDDPIDIEGPVVEKAWASYVFNRRRDFADQSRAISSIPAGASVTSVLVEGHVPYNFTSASGLAVQRNFGITRRPTKSLPYRLGMAVAGDRIILCSRGYGVMFQIPALIPSVGSFADNPVDGVLTPRNSDHDAPRSLGVPKAILIDYPTAGKDSTTIQAPLIGAIPSPFVQNGSGFEAGTYKIAVAYRDDATGEIGQLSEPWTFTLPTVVPGLLWQVSFDVMHPGYVLAETGALTLLVFMSKAGQDAMGLIDVINLGDQYSFLPLAATSQSSKYGLTVYASNASGDSGAIPHPLYYRHVVPTDYAQASSYFADLAYDFTFAPPTQNQMPRGAKCVSVTRGVMISGGSAASFGRDGELIPGKLGTNFTSPNPLAALPAFFDDRRLFQSRPVDSENRPLDTIPWPSGNGKLPSSYAGSPVFSVEAFPSPNNTQTLQAVVNPTKFVQSTNAEARDSLSFEWFRLRDYPYSARESILSFWGKTSYVQQFRGFLQTSELGKPSITVSQGTVPIDAKKDDDIEATGEFRGTQVVCSRRQTFGLLWSTHPLGSVPFTVSNEFGCIATNSMVEGDNMLAWISDRGPVAFLGQSVEHIGRSLQRDFHGNGSRFLKDSKGRMLHSWGCHDEERGLLLFGLFENRNRGLATEVKVSHLGSVPKTWDNSTDEAKSRFPCDVVLAYSEMDNAWSEFHPPDGMEALWMGMVTCSDGIRRLAWLAQDLRLYVFEEEFGDTVKEPLILTATVSSTSATVTVDETVGETKDDRSADTFVRAGSEAIVFDGATKEIKARSTVVSAAGSTVVLADSITVAKGHRILVGPKTMTIQFVSSNLKGSAPTSLGSVTLRAETRSRLQNGGSGAIAQPAWARVTDTTVTHPTSAAAVQDRAHTFHANVNGDFLGDSSSAKQSRLRQLDSGTAEGFEHRITVEVFGGAQVCLQDVLVGIG